MIKKVAIVVASGFGSRMGSEIPKQFMHIGNKPILVRTIEKFLLVPNCSIIVALSEDGFGFWDIYCAHYFKGNSEIKFIKGGEARFQSVKNAINSIDFANAVVAIHDAVRPFVDLETINSSFQMAETHGTAVTSVDAKDSLRMVLNDTTNKALDRTRVKVVQTPQTFKLDILRRAFDTEFKDTFTDDASVVEFYGESIYLIEGSYSNVKITTPEDLALGEILIQQFERKD